jgi:hypothetical protein
MAVKLQTTDASEQKKSSKKKASAVKDLLPNLSLSTLELMKKVMSGKAGPLRTETPKKSKSPLRKAHDQDISISKIKIDDSPPI